MTVNEYHTILHKMLCLLYSALNNFYCSDKSIL